jgi:hypothetical protein
LHKAKWIGHMLHKAKWIGHMLHKDSLTKHIIEGKKAGKWRTRKKT